MKAVACTLFALLFAVAYGTESCGPNEGGKNSEIVPARWLRCPARSRRGSAKATDRQRLDCASFPECGATCSSG
uniref:Secreted protein n=1 Tax=Trichogramma kaykai TaxID=54128 RepID=A0ABD2VSP8_9HYME